MKFLRFVLSGVLFSACGGTQPVEYVINDLRVVSVVASAPEVSPGDTITITAYFVSPNATAPVANFGICPTLGTEERDTDCAPADEIILASGTATSVGPMLYAFSTSYTVPEDIMSGADLIAQTYGYDEVLLAHGDAAGQSIDSLKRIVVLPGDPAPNTNPSFAALFAASDGAPIGSASLGGITSPPSILRAEKFIALPDYDAGSLQAFQIKTYSGTPMNETEEAIFSWSCANNCTLDTDITYGMTSVSITPPASGPLVIYCVMRDGRGGEALQAMEVNLTGR